MKRIGYIENVSASTVSFTNFSLTSGNTIPFSGQFGDLFSIHKLRSSYYLGELIIKDEDSVEMTSGNTYDFIKFYEHNISMFSGNTYVANELRPYLDFGKITSDFSLFPIDVKMDYNFYRDMFSQKTYNKGYLVKDELFRNVSEVAGTGGTFSSLEYSMPIMKEEYEYTVNDLGLISDKKITRAFYKHDNTYGSDTSVQNVKYGIFDALIENKKRRSLVIDLIKKDVSDYISITETGVTDSYEALGIVNDFILGQSGLTSFIEGSTSTLINDISGYTSSNYYWIDNNVSEINMTIKSYVIDALTASTMSLSGTVS